MASCVLDGVLPSRIRWRPRPRGPLLCLGTEAVLVVSAVVWIPDLKTANGVAEVPLTELAVNAFTDQMQIAGNGPYLFPSDGNSLGHRGTFKTAWSAALGRAKR